LIKECLVVLLLSATTVPVTVCAEAGGADVQEAKLNQLRERIGVLKGELGSMRGQSETVQAELEKTEKEIGVIASAMRDLDGQARQGHKKIQGLNKQRDAERKNMQAMRLLLTEELKGAYMAGKQERVKLLLNQENPAGIGRMMVYHGYFTRARTARMQEIRLSLQHIDSIEQALSAQQDEIQQLLQQQRDKSLQLANGQNKRRKIIEQLQSGLKDKSSELSTLERDEKQLQQLIQSLRQALSDIPSASGQHKSLRPLKGKLQWPVKGRISMRYGEQQASGKLRSRGVRIATPSGSDVQAISSGRVAFSDWLRGFGLLLIIEHGGGYMSLYGHNRSLYKDVGEWVERGDVIAASGDSGGQLQAGLYLELRKDGQPFNPAPWFNGIPVAVRAGR
jgi:septal ring factor EnvC (AmiA/AmiB activator)